MLKYNLDYKAFYLLGRSSIKFSLSYVFLNDLNLQEKGQNFPILLLSKNIVFTEEVLAVVGKH